jgi:hypothetical protein
VLENFVKINVGVTFIKGHKHENLINKIDFPNQNRSISRFSFFFMILSLSNCFLKNNEKKSQRVKQLPRFNEHFNLIQAAYVFISSAEH